MWIDPPYVDVRALLGIAAPISETSNQGERRLKPGRPNRSMERNEPGAFEKDPFWVGVWARLSFKPYLANPFLRESSEFAQWSAGWKQEESATWEVTGAREVVLEKVFHRTIHWGPRTCFSVGLAAMLEGRSRLSNPCLASELEFEQWDEGWLRGFWLKGYAAARLGEPLSFSAQVVRSRQVGSHGGPLPEGSEELDWWQAGWEACARRLELELALDEIRAAGEFGGDLGATVAANPYRSDTEESEAWLAGWKVGSRSQLTEYDFDDPTGSGSVLLEWRRSQGASGCDAYVRGDPLDANPFVSGTREWFRWKRDWRLTEDFATGVYEDYDEVPEDYDPDDREGNAHRAMVAREEQASYFAEMDALMTAAAFSDEEEEEFDRRFTEEFEAEERRIEELVAEALKLNRKD